MSDWQVGDLAVCVDDSPLTSTPLLIRVGGVYRIERITTANDTLFLEGRTGGQPWAYRSYRFRRPDTHEPCEAKFKTLLKRKRVSA